MLATLLASVVVLAACGGADPESDAREDPLARSAKSTKTTGTIDRTVKSTLPVEPVLISLDSSTDSTTEVPPGTE